MIVRPTDQRGQSRPVDGDFFVTSECDIGAVELNAAVPSSVMGFEDASQWQMLWSSGTLSNNSEVKTGGANSMQLTGNGWQQIKSIDISTRDLPTVTDKPAFDLFIGTNQPNQYWIGQVQLYINCPSANIYNQYIGFVDLTKLPLGQFSTMLFDLPSNVVNAMNGNHTDFSFSISLNTNPGSGPYFFDSMRFVP